MNSGDDLINHWLDELKPPHWRGFVYVSEAIDSSSSSSEQLQSDDRASVFSSSQAMHTHVFPLSNMQVGDRVRIVALNCGEANNRLMGMGLIPNAILEVISCTRTGSVIVALQDQRLGLGADMAQQIQVIDAEQPLGNQLGNQLGDPLGDQFPDSARRTTMPLNSIPQVQSSQAPSTDSSTHSSPLGASVKLRDASIGTKLRIVGYEPVARDYKRKLLAMGLTPGTELLVKRHAPLGDPTEIEVRGFRLSLRKHEADALVVELV
ncbi:MAG: ferrous iron transport protein A [Elainella sp. Prado103]|nr:ferrous iron transport protein A [Elainella sp. Prado103]